MYCICHDKISIDIHFTNFGFFVEFVLKFIWTTVFITCFNLVLYLFKKKEEIYVLLAVAHDMRPCQMQILFFFDIFIPYSLYPY